MTRPSMRDTPADVAAIFQSLPGRLRADRVVGFRGVFHFEIPDAATPQWTITIDQGECTVVPGLLGDPNCTVTMDEQTFLTVETGQQNPMMAFVKGRIRVTNVGQMRKYDRAFFRFHDIPAD